MNNYKLANNWVHLANLAGYASSTCIFYIVGLPGCLKMCSVYALMVSDKMYYIIPAMFELFDAKCKWYGLKLFFF